MSLSRYKNSLFVFVVFLTGAVTTFLLHTTLAVHPVLSSAGLGLGASFLLPFFSQEEILLPAFYCGTFIGMSSLQIFSSHIILLTATCFGAIIFFFSKKYFNGLGGKLGTIAFISVLVVFLGSKLF